MTDRAVKWEEVVFPTYTNLDGITVGRELGYQGTARVDDERTAEITVRPDYWSKQGAFARGNCSRWVWQVNSFVNGKLDQACSGFGSASTPQKAQWEAEERISAYRAGEDLAWWDMALGFAGR